MARSLTSAARAQAQRQSGAEPFLVIEIVWGDGSRWYGDKSTYIGTQEVDGRILSVSPIQFGISVEDVGSTSVLSITLSDNDLALRTLMESQLLENRQCRVYHHFEGLAEADLVTLLNGVVTSPIRWDESNRRLTFSIEGTVNSQTIGYRPADGDFPNLHEDGIGRVWPVCFGTPLDVPAALVSAAARGRLATDVDMNTVVFDVIDGDQFTQGSQITLKVGEELMKGTFSGTKVGVRTFTTSLVLRNQYNYLLQGFANRPITDPDVSDSHFAWVVEAHAVNKYVGLWFEIDAAYVPGSSTNKANYCISQEGTKLRFQFPWSNGITEDWEITPTIFADCRAFNGTEVFRILKAGSPVTEWGSEQDVFVANELPSSAVLRVRAWKQVNYNAVGASYRAFVDVPSTYYTVNLADAGLGAPDSRTPTTITFATRLSERGDWEDSVVYVSLTSTQGDNTADVIEWILNNYTDLTPDVAAFASVQAKVENYPNHFAIIEQKDGLKACGEIAWQARCGLFSVGATAYLRYLSEEPDAGDAAITIDDNEDNTLEADAQLLWTKLEDVITVFNARWKEDLSEEWRIIPYEVNVDELGSREKEFDFYIYQTQSLVEKSASFWSGRYGRAWRLVELNTFLDALGLDVLDSVLLYLTDLSLPSSKTVVKEVSHDTKSHLIQLLLWLPIEAGTIVQSAAAWVDDSGDVKPADPSVNISEVEYEIWSVPPTQFSFPTSIAEASKTVPAKISSDLGGGQYRAVTYPKGFSGSPSDTIIVTKIGDTDFSVNDETLATRVEEEQTSAWYSSKGGGGTQVAPGLLLSGSGSGPYSVALYEDGQGNPSTQTVNAYPLQIASGASFPAGIWTFVVYISAEDKYYFQPPVWLDDS